jgi:hypothetical protein
MKEEGGRKRKNASLSLWSFLSSFRLPPSSLLFGGADPLL